MRIVTRISRLPSLKVGWTQFLVTLGTLTLLAPLLWLAGASDWWSLYAVAVLIAASGGLFTASEYRIASRFGWPRVSPRRSVKLLKRWDVVVLVVACVVVAPAIPNYTISNAWVAAAVLLFIVTCIYVVVLRRAAGRHERPVQPDDITPEESQGAQAPLN
jgi:hypothetical protein